MKMPMFVQGMMEGGMVEMLNSGRITLKKGEELLGQLAGVGSMRDTEIRAELDHAIRVAQKTGEYSGPRKVRKA